VEAAACTITTAPKQATDASPSARSTSDAIHDVDPSSSDGCPTYCTIDMANWVADGLIHAPIAISVTIIVNGVASDCTTPTTVLRMRPLSSVPLSPA
jgi:hypothetical protein